MIVVVYVIVLSMLALLTLGHALAWIVGAPLQDSTQWMLTFCGGGFGWSYCVWRFLLKDFW